MSLPTDPNDPTRQFKEWQPYANQTVIVHGSQGAAGHGYIQQDPSHAWYDDVGKRWLFIGGSNIDGGPGHASGVPILELFGSVAGDDWSKGFEFLSIFSQQGLAMCDPDIILFPSTNVSVLYVCTNQYLIGHVVPTNASTATATATSKQGFRFEQLSTMPGGVQKIEYGAGAGKGFYHAALDRYLLWMMSEGRGYSSAREVTVDEEIPLLLSYPAREYAAMRQAPQASLQGVDRQHAAASLMSCAGAAQLDLDLVFHFGGGGGPSAGDCVGVSVLGGGMVAAITFKSPGVGVLDGRPCGRY